MGSRLRAFLVAVSGVLVILGCWTASAAAATYVGTPALSSAPRFGLAVTASGITTPTAKSGVKTVVKVQVRTVNGWGVWMPVKTLTAKLVKRSGSPGYRYSCSFTPRMVGKMAFRALRYANGRLVGRSAFKYATVTYGSGQLAHWTFNETSGTVAADVAGDADGSLEGSPVWGVGWVGGSLSFDGNDGVRVGDASGLRSPAVTYAAWVYPTAYPNGYNEVMIFQRDTGGYRGAVVLYLNALGQPAVQFQNGNSITVDIRSTMNISTDHWAFLAVSYDGAVVRLFVNGVLKASAAYAGGIDYGAGPWQLHMGGDLYYAPGGNAFSGRIDEPAVLSRALK